MYFPPSVGKGCCANLVSLCDQSGYVGPAHSLLGPWIWHRTLAYCHWPASPHSRSSWASWHRSLFFSSDCSSCHTSPGNTSRVSGAQNPRLDAASFPIEIDPPTVASSQRRRVLGLCTRLSRSQKLILRHEAEVAGTGWRELEWTKTRRCRVKKGRRMCRCYQYTQGKKERRVEDKVEVAAMYISPST